MGKGKVKIEEIVEETPVVEETIETPVVEETKWKDTVAIDKLSFNGKIYVKGDSIELTEEEKKGFIKGWLK